MTILLNLASRLTDPEPTVILSCTSNEEIGAIGALYLTQHRPIDAMIALEVAPIAPEYTIKDISDPVLLMEDGWSPYDDTLNSCIRDAASRRQIGLQLASISSFASDASISRLPAVSHGLNEPHFIACHAVASTIALVHNHASAKFLAMLGLTDSQIRTVICYQSEYQAIMRCSLRDPDAIAPVAIIVPSRASAEWIASKFERCAISKLNTGLDWEAGKVGRPKTLRAMTSAERVRKHRAMKKVAEAGSLLVSPAFMQQGGDRRIAY